MSYKYPKGERVFTGYYNSRGELLFILTSKEARDYYYIYKVVGECFVKLGKSKSPKDLEEKFKVIETIRGGEHD